VEDLTLKAAPLGNSRDQRVERLPLEQGSPIR
jgi:hypothetical protein